MEGSCSYGPLKIQQSGIPIKCVAQLQISTKFLDKKFNSLYYVFLHKIVFYWFSQEIPGLMRSCNSFEISLYIL